MKQHYKMKRQSALHDDFMTFCEGNLQGESTDH